ncbi:YbaB/EbfC family nucleoid-associated protein [Saccharopolyspora gregorii]|uniref:YbaB/EbfC family DNA-binding protein n=1 Tax=Saccharopolyspora gregorii TaxID=33914 RepID=A0ABP6RKJ5_9PSEU
MDWAELRRTADALDEQARLIREAREEQETLRFRGSSENGVATATCTGGGALLELDIRAGALASSRPEMISRDLLESIRAARRSAGEAVGERLQQLAPGFTSEAE